VNKLERDSNGFSVVEFLLIIVTVAIISVVSYSVVKHGDNKTTPQSPTNISQTALVITRSNPLKQPGVSNFTIKINNLQMAHMLLADIDNLQPPLSGEVNCPEDDGVNYILQFNNPSETFNVASSGCEDVTLNSKTVYTANTTNNSGATFWKDLSKATGHLVNPDDNL
jgi:hypothetical protein